jgi:type II secretory pathway pseudopilin PulG
MTTQPSTPHHARAWLAGGTLSLRPWLGLLLLGVLATLAGSTYALSVRVRAQRDELRHVERAAQAALDLQQHQLDECLIQAGALAPPSRPTLPEKP